MSAGPLSLDADGWCPQAQRYDSPHRDARPDPDDISLLVIHNISLPAGRYGGPHVSDLFTGRLDYNTDPAFAGLRGLKVSSHFFIRRDGRLLQYVSAADRAWHAGRSAFRGREKCNDYAIGVELEGTDASGYEEAQYQALAALTAALAARYRLTDVQGHEHIAPGRKTDPGPLFNWEYYRFRWAQLMRKQTATGASSVAGSGAALGTVAGAANSRLCFAKGSAQSQ